MVRRPSRLDRDAWVTQSMENREYTKATVYLADWQLERFLDFCEEELEQLPELSRVPPDELNGYKEFFQLLAAREDERLSAEVPPERLN